MAGGLSILYGVFAVGHAFVLPPAVAAPMIVLAAATAAVLLLLWYILGRRPISARWAHPVGAVMIGLALLNSLVHFYLVPEPQQTTNIALLSIGTGCFFLSNGWLALTLAVAWAGWGSIAWSAPPSPAWIHFAFMLFGATVISELVHGIRLRTFQKLERMRAQEAQRVKELEEAVQAAQQSEERFHQLAEATFEGIAIHESDRILDANQNLAGLFGYEMSEIIGRRVSQLIVTESRERVLEYLLTEHEEPCETIGLRKDGSTFLIQLRGKAVPHLGRAVRVLAVRDLSERQEAVHAQLRAEIAEEAKQALENEMAERKQIEEQREQALSLLQATLDSTTDGLLVVKRDGKIVSFNQRFLQIWKIPEEMVTSGDDKEAISFVLDQLKSPEEFLAKINEVYAQPEAESYDSLAFKDGRIVERFSKPQCLGGKIIGRVWSFRDITERRRAEEATRAERERLAVTLRAIGDGVITTDTAGRVLLLNKIAEDLTGWRQEEALGKPLQEVFHLVQESTRAALASPVEAVLRSGKAAPLDPQTVLITRGGMERLVGDISAPIHDERGRIIGVVVVFRDITEKRRLEAEMIKIEKMNALSILAGGIAHDFNNMLTAILGHISLAKLPAQTPEEQERILTEAERACLRARRLTQQLLTFSKGGAPILQTASLKDVLHDTIHFALRDSNIRYEYYIPGDLWTVQMDTDQVSQAIYNLAVNAQQAMPRGGTIRVTARNMEWDARRDLPLRPGRYVLFSIDDEGVGIRKEDLPYIFDPFFTTKTGGSGLGLSSTYSIIRNHGGHIVAKSTPGAGTTFNIYLPASAAKPSETMEPAEVNEPGEGRILVMDDDEAVRTVIVGLLRSLGYKAEVAGDGMQAIKIYQQAKAAGQPFAAVIMDLTIPGGMGGKEAIGKLREIDTSARVIASSGYSNDDIMAHYEKYGFNGVISKPYRLKELQQVLNRVLKE